MTTSIQNRNLIIAKARTVSSMLLYLGSIRCCNAFTVGQGTNSIAARSAFCRATCHPPFTIIVSHGGRSNDLLKMIYAPPGSGYMGQENADDDESVMINKNVFPDTYEPIMEYPGTMRPGRTPENQPYDSLPIADTDPDPVPWPHFQEIEWHHNWGSPHDHPIPMEEFIELQGRWASVEDEAAMRADARRGVRERREEMESSGDMDKALTLIMDDDDDDDDDNDDDVDEDITKDLGTGVILQSTDKLRAPPKTDPDKEVDDEEDDDDEDGDDFLLDLGLDADDGTGATETDNGTRFVTQENSPKNTLNAMQSVIEEEEDIDEAEDDIDLSIDLGLLEEDDADLDEEEGSVDLALEENMILPSIVVDEDDDNDADINLEEIDVDEDAMGDDQQMVPLDEMIDSEDMGDDDSFDDGGFDYNDFEGDGDFN